MLISVNQSDFTLSNFLHIFVLYNYVVIHMPINLKLLNISQEKLIIREKSYFCVEEMCFVILSNPVSRLVTPQIYVVTLFGMS